jgi:hypothetical protein
VALASWNLGLCLGESGSLASAVAAMQVRVDFERSVGHPDADKHAAAIDELLSQLKR